MIKEWHNCHEMCRGNTWTGFRDASTKVLIIKRDDFVWIVQFVSPSRYKELKSTWCSKHIARPFLCNNDILRQCRAWVFSSPEWYRLEKRSSKIIQENGEASFTAHTWPVVADKKPASSLVNINLAVKCGNRAEERATRRKATTNSNWGCEVSCLPSGALTGSRR